METSIIHLNIADFAVAVERRVHPDLKTTPLIIAPQGSPRAVVYDMSEEAFQEGVRKGMNLKNALRICPSAKVLPPLNIRYEMAMKDLLKKALSYSPLIESGQDDGHLFMDVTGTSRLFGPPMDVAWRLNKKMKKDTGLDPVWSVASNKLVAKVATRIVKPVGEYIVEAGDEESFLAPLPLNLIPGFTPKDLNRLKEFNFFKVSQVRTLDMQQLAVVFDSNRAPVIHDRIRGIDRTTVLPLNDSPSIEADYEFAEDTNGILPLKRALYLLAEQICHKLRLRNRQAAAIKLILSYSDGIQRESAVRLTPSCTTDMEMFEKSLPMLYKAWNRRVRIRHMRFACTNHTPLQIQMTLFDSNSKRSKQNRLVHSIDKIRERFGHTSISSALALSV